MSLLTTGSILDNKCAARLLIGGGGGGCCFSLICVVKSGISPPPIPLSLPPSLYPIQLAKLAGEIVCARLPSQGARLMIGSRALAVQKICLSLSLSLSFFLSLSLTHSPAKPSRQARARARARLLINRPVIYCTLAWPPLKCNGTAAASTAAAGRLNRARARALQLTDGQRENSRAPLALCRKA